ncbi:hypothetical protein GCL60_16655 [Silvanigrella paludirubra]|uniref:Uncharacterized protein n=1 Tax=Silvanigrella paludirubra TaxID=2499159 RepID=A0A6N6VQC8_9BACT|nr:hypothetical protein [Silvanigrella paludirubra]KAB8035860.1 hypothetical protein GCL60_16655 [Silvanigrella paludirubra]
MPIILDRHKGYICTNCSNTICNSSKGIYTCPKCKEVFDSIKNTLHSGNENDYAKISREKILEPNLD